MTNDALACNLCSHAPTYTRQSDLTRHMKRKHPETIEVEAASDVDPKHLEVLAALVDENTVDYVTFGNSWNPEQGSFPTSTLRAMERKGLVELSYMQEGMIHTSTKPFRIARITPEGFAAVRGSKDAVDAPASAEVVHTVTGTFLATGETVTGRVIEMTAQDFKRGSWDYFLIETEDGDKVIVQTERAA